MPVAVGLMEVRFCFGGGFLKLSSVLCCAVVGAFGLRFRGVSIGGLVGSTTQTEARRAVRARGNIYIHTE